MRVGVILVNWNGWRDTVECLESLVPAMRGGDVAVVVVDNASTNDSVMQLERWGARIAHELSFGRLVSHAPTKCPNIALVVADENRGFAAGNNIGIEVLRAHYACDYYWLLNNDTVIEADAIEALVKFAEARPEVGVIGSTIVEHQERGRIQCAGGAYYDPRTTVNWAALAGCPRDGIEHAREPRMNYICGAAMFMRAALVDHVGLLEEEYFLYYEEIDYARRATSMGYAIGWCRDAIVYHKGGASTGGNRSRTTKKSALAEYHANLSCLKFTRRFEPDSLRVISATRFALKTGYLLATRQWQLLPTLVRAYVDFFGEDAP